MIETPPSFAATPESARGRRDVLAETLREVRLTGAVFLNARFTAPFGIISPKQYDGSTPMARLRHITVFHLITAGGCTVEIATGERRTSPPGTFCSCRSPTRTNSGMVKTWRWRLPTTWFVPAPSRACGASITAAGATETKMVCGFIESSEFLSLARVPHAAALPVDRMGDDKVSAVITSTVKEILALADTAAPGSEIMLGRLMELLFIEVVRRYAARLPANATGWFAALNDPIVGRALQFVHADPARRWTVDGLARESGSSRTVLAERFNEVLARRRSNMSPIGGCNWRPSASATAPTASPQSPPMSAMARFPPSTAPSSA